MTNTIEKNTEKKKFDKIITDIETVLDCAFKVPGFGVVVNPKELSKQLGVLNKAVGSAVEEADHIVNVKDKILSDTRAEAEEIIRRRQLEIAKQPVLKEAENIAKKMLLQAKEEADKMVRNAKQFESDMKLRTHRYADMVFEELLKGNGELQKQLAKDRQELKVFLDGANREERNKEVKEEANINTQRKLS